MGAALVSYSGTNNPALTTMGGPITETGTFTHNWWRHIRRANTREGSVFRPPGRRIAEEIAETTMNTTYLVLASMRGNPCYATAFLFQRTFGKGWAPRRVEGVTRCRV